MATLKYKNDLGQWEDIISGETNTTHTPEECHKLIVSEMNKKAKLLGMTNTFFNNPYGGNLYGYNKTTARDLMKLTVHSYSYPKVMEYLSLKGSRNIPVYGTNERVYTLANDIQTDFDVAYANVHGSGTCPYQMLAGKGGGWSSNNPEGVRVFAYTLIAQVEGKMVAGVVSRVSNGDTTHTGREYRLMAMIQLLDICAKKIKGETTSDEVTYAEYACATIIPENTRLWQNRTFTTLYEKNADTQFNPASTSKVMSALIIMDAGFDAFEYHDFVAEEVAIDSGVDFKAQIGDILCVDDSMYLNLILSNGPNTLALSRHCANKMFKQKK
jgi:hypothetical protein